MANTPTAKEGVWRVRRCSASVVAVAAFLLAAGAAETSGPVVRWGAGAAPPPSVDGTTGTATAIAAGADHDCAIQAGTHAVVCWGNNEAGKATPPASVNGTAGTATAIALGYSHTCAIQAQTGAVVCWGDNLAGKATPPSSVNGTAGTATAIGADQWGSCAIQAGSGAAVCWPQGLGLEGPPSSVNGTAGSASAIAGGIVHGCAIQAGTGAVVCWPASEAVPPSLNGTGGRASAVAVNGELCLSFGDPEGCAGTLPSCAIRAGTGEAICWGTYGEAPPPAVDGTTGTATAIAVGWYYHGCAIQAGTGAVVCWGDDSNGQATPPPSVDGTAGTAEAIAAGIGHTIAISNDMLACANGLDDDGDGLADAPADPGCADAADTSERSPSLACDDGFDDDADGLTDFPMDPGCRTASATLEDPECQDGFDNDGHTGIDFDGGASLNGGVPVGAPDPQCTAAWKNREAASSCGLGVELALLVPLLDLGRRRRSGLDRGGATRCSPGVADGPV